MFYIHLLAVGSSNWCANGVDLTKSVVGVDASDHLHRLLLLGMQVGCRSHPSTTREIVRIEGKKKVIHGFHRTGSSRPEHDPTRCVRTACSAPASNSGHIPAGWRSTPLYPMLSINFGKIGGGKSYSIDSIDSAI